MNIFLACGLIFLFALGSSKLLSRLKFPAVTSYLLLGILIGPYGLKLIPENLVKATDFIGYLVLGIVAFSLGENFLWRKLRKIGREVVVISVAAVLGCLILVGLAIRLIGQPISVSLILGAVATATAPMATIMVIREYRARGSFTDMLVNIVAVDDAWGIIVFAMAMAGARIASSHGTGNAFAEALVAAGSEIIGALILGAACGVLLSFLSRYSRTQMESLIFGFGFILMTVGISLTFGLSPLLANMAMGVAVINATKRHIFFDVLRRIDWPFYLLFFVLCGTSLEITLLRHLTVIAVVYMVARVIGKYIGAYLGANIAHVEDKIKQYLGIGLIPQAGVALGLAIVAKSEFPSLGNVIFTTVVATTIIFEIVGPFCTKFAVTKAGEVER